MARTVRDTVLSTRSARLRLALSGKPYWRMLEQGLHLGYRRRATGGSWIARRRDENGIYHEEKLGRADDLQDADDATILDFTQAQRVARRWWTNQQRLAAGLPADDGPYTVKRAITDYLDDYRRRGAKGAEVIESVVGRNVLPALLAFPQGHAAQYCRIRPKGSRSSASPARQRQPGAHLSQGRPQPRLAQRHGALR
jgi:hypothetical protein